MELNSFLNAGERGRDAFQPIFSVYLVLPLLVDGARQPPWSAFALLRGMRLGLGGFARTRSLGNPQFLVPGAIIGTAWSFHFLR